MSGEFRDAVRRRGSFVQTLKAVAWSFFGVRRRSGLEQDAARINPVHLVIAALVAAALFIGVLIAVVDWVVGASGAH